MVPVVSESLLLVCSMCPPALVGGMLLLSLVTCLIVVLCSRKIGRRRPDARAVANTEHG